MLIKKKEKKMTINNIEIIHVRIIVCILMYYLLNISMNMHECYKLVYIYIYIHRSVAKKFCLGSQLMILIY